MRLFQEGDVSEDEIDELGHLTASAYVRRAFHANRILLAELGLSGQETSLVEADTFRRFHREQFQGARLAVNGGVIQLGPRDIQAYYEVRNTVSDELAATLIVATRLWRSDRKGGDLPEGVRQAAEPLRVDPPDYGRPRTLDLSAPVRDIRLAAIAGRFASDPMWPDFEWTAEAGMIGDHGFLAGLSTGLWPPAGSAALEWTFECDGHRLGWATVEKRTLRVSPVRPGERLRSMGAEIVLGRKVRHSCRWIFETSTGRLVTRDDDVMVALDLDARGTIEIPPSLRARLETHFAPDLA